MAWTILGEGSGRHMGAIHRAARHVLANSPFRRVEADTPVGFAQGRKWLEKLGFSLEAERAVAYYQDGGDAALYARVL